MKFPFTPPTVAEAEAALATASEAARTAAAARETAAQELRQAYLADDAKGITATEAALARAEAAEKRSRMTYEAAEERLASAQDSDTAKQREQHIRARDRALRDRAKAAKLLDEGAAALAKAVSLLGPADDALMKARAFGVISRNAVAGHNYGRPRIEALVAQALTRHKIPGAQSYLGDASQLPSAAESVEADNATIRSGDA